ncbi:MAG TPA: hypothetical protein VFX97_08340 [Pyrinomonadaceae bacterium]|nr:hypothetical protein [Pyrinomonadaceae bacterium]
MEIYYKTDDEIHALVSAFEACSFHPAEFRHYQHLTVALWYVWHLSPDEASLKMTKGIRRLSETYGKMGYHETITLFWLRIVANLVAEHRANMSLSETANALIDRCKDKDLIAQFYSDELLATDKAKAEWVEPDLKALPEAIRTARR